MVGKLRCPTAHREDIYFILLEGAFSVPDLLSFAEVPLSQDTFLAFLGVFELGSLLCATANGSPMFIVGRAVAGMGRCGLDEWLS
jgi:MFS family permease